MKRDAEANLAILFQLFPDMTQVKPRAPVEMSSDDESMKGGDDRSSDPEKPSTWRGVTISQFMFRYDPTKDSTTAADTENNTAASNARKHDEEPYTNNQHSDLDDQSSNSTESSCNSLNDDNDNENRPDDAVENVEVKLKTTQKVIEEIESSASYSSSTLDEKENQDDGSSSSSLVADKEFKKEVMKLSSSECSSSSSGYSDDEQQSGDIEIAVATEMKIEEIQSAQQKQKQKFSSKADAEIKGMTKDDDGDAIVERNRKNDGKGTSSSEDESSTNDEGSSTVQEGETTIVTGDVPARFLEKNANKKNKDNGDDTLTSGEELPKDEQSSTDEDYETKLPLSNIQAGFLDKPKSNASQKAAESDQGEKRSPYLDKKRKKLDTAQFH